MLNARLSAYFTNRRSIQKKTVKSGKIRTCPNVVDFVLGNYATDEILEETELANRQFAQPARRRSLQCVKELVRMNPRCGDRFEKFAINERFTEGLDQSIRLIMREFWGACKEATLLHLSFHASLMLRVRGKDALPKRTSKRVAVQVATRDKPHMSHCSELAQNLVCTMRN